MIAITIRSSIKVNRTPRLDRNNAEDDFFSTRILFTRVFFLFNFWKYFQYLKEIVPQKKGFVKQIMEIFPIFQKKIASCAISRPALRAAEITRGEEKTGFRSEIAETGAERS